MINETKNYFAFFSSHSIVRFSQLLWTNISFLKIFVFTTIKRDPLKHNKADKIWIWNCRLLHFCDFTTRNLLSSLIWRKIWAILKKRTDWRTVMSFESMILFLFSLCQTNSSTMYLMTSYWISLQYQRYLYLIYKWDYIWAGNFWFLDIRINARSTLYLEIK